LDTNSPDIVARHRLPAHRLTIADYYRMAEAGIIAKKARVELIQGQVIDMAPIGPRHTLVVTQLMHLLVPMVDRFTHVRPQGPIRLDDHSMPEPDIAIVRRPWAGYPAEHPSPTDIHLLIEVADSSVLRDSTAKAELYARSNIAEYWIVDLTQDIVVVHQKPENGFFALKHTLRGPAILQAQALPNVSLTAAHIFE